MYKTTNEDTDDSNNNTTSEEKLREIRKTERSTAKENEESSNNKNEMKRIRISTQYTQVKQTGAVNIIGGTRNNCASSPNVLHRLEPQIDRGVTLRGTETLP